MVQHKKSDAHLESNILPDFVSKAIRKNSREFFWLLLVINLTTSCTSYKKMLVPAIVPDYTQFYRADRDLSQLIRQKEKLDSAALQIVEKINVDKAIPRAIRANEINSLFDNLRDQFQIDLTFQAISDMAGADSVKNGGWEMLIKSADFYNNVFQQDKFLRRIINRGDAAHNVPARLLLRSQKFLWDRKNQRRIEERHVFLSLTEKNRSKFAREKRQDFIFNTTYKVLGLGSEVISRLISAIHGKADARPNVARVIPLLKKWDIVIQKSPKRLSDKFIPGHFGHSGIYLGDSVFAEVVERGARYVSPLNFLEGNEFIVIRPGMITDDRDKEMQNLLKAQIGKKYDFNFNVESPNQLACTEVIYLVYDQVDWETQKIAGRYMIPPDCFVRTALKSDKFEVQYYIDREETIEIPKQNFIEELLKKK